MIDKSSCMYHILFIVIGIIKSLFNSLSIDTSDGYEIVEMHTTAGFEWESSCSIVTAYCIKVVRGWKQWDIPCRNI